MIEKLTIKIVISAPEREPLRLNIACQDVDLIYKDIQKLVIDYLKKNKL